MELSDNHKKLKAFLTAFLGGNIVLEDEFILCFKEKEVDEGECIAKSGEVCNKLVFVVNGLLGLCFVNSNGDEFINGFFSANSLVTSYFSFKEQAVSDFCLLALKPSQLLIIRYDELMNPASGEVGQLLLTRYGNLEHQRKERHDIMLYNKDAETRYRWFSVNYPNLKGNICDSYVASFLGLSRECVVRKKKIVSCCKL